MVISTYLREETHIWDNYESKIFDMYFGGDGICVLDIETTGLYPGNSHFVLGSLLFIGEGEALLKQYFAEDISEEKLLLAKYAEEAAACDVLLTYNGKRFDIPFLLSRSDKLDFDIPRFPYNLDLYLVLNDHSTLRKLLPNLKQKTVEDFMGLWHCRKDLISGAESAALYNEYIYLKEAGEDASACIEPMLLHNKDDVLQLGRLLPVLEKADFHRAMHRLGFPVAGSGKRLAAESIKLDDGCLAVKGSQISAPFDFISYGNGGDCDIIFGKKSRDFEIRFPALINAGLEVIDLTKLTFDVRDELSAFPNSASGYLVVKNDGDIKYAEINRFIKTYLRKLLKDIPEGAQ